MIVQLKSFDCFLFHNRIEKIYLKMSEVYNAADTTSDVDWFRKCNGPDVPFIEITFVVSTALNSIICFYSDISIDIA